MDIELVPILVSLGFFGMIAYIAKVIGDTRIRRKALESHVANDVAKAVVNRQWAEPSTRAALKWGLIIVSLGIGILLVDLFPIDFESPLAYALLLFSTGTALLGYYLIERENDAVNMPDAETTSPASTERVASEEVHDPEL